MKKIIFNKTLIIVCALIAAFLILLGIDMKNIKPVIIAVFPIGLIIMTLLWRIEYDDTSFTSEFDDIIKLEYQNIKRIIHYKAHIGRGAVDHFIIEYAEKSEDGEEGDIQKATIKDLFKYKEMREFFNFVSDKNPAIEFYLEQATSEGVERYAFDYF
ncbi:MAG: hypothetical protein J6W60_09150 [Treponema sp.]|nr:hypothetical protein [Treponema sp.]MBP5753006.1 hypothetical protein [Treponema sp.]